MDQNLLTGTVPASLGHLEGLQELNLGYNNFVGSIPEGVCQLENLIFIADCYEIDCPCCTECTSGS
jgi:LRR receptor-like serine/threonine-protein kinase FLS2